MGTTCFMHNKKMVGFLILGKILEYFTREQHVRLVNAFWYTGLKDHQDQRGFRDALISSGIYGSH